MQMNETMTVSTMDREIEKHYSAVSKVRRDLFVIRISNVKIDQSTSNDWRIEGGLGQTSAEYRPILAFIINCKKIQSLTNN